MRLNHRELAEASIIEEASEVIKVLMKIKRFGLYAMNPYKPEEGTNLTQLAAEVGDLLGAIDFLLETHPELDEALIYKNQQDRRRKLLNLNEGERFDEPFVLKDGKLYLHGMLCVGSVERTDKGFMINNDGGVPMKITAESDKDGVHVTSLSFEPKGDSH